MSESLDGRALAECVHENVVATFVEGCGRMTGGRVERLGGAVLVASGLPSLLFNQVLVEPGDPSAEAVAAGITAAVGRFRELGTRFVVTLRGGIDHAQVSLMAELGLEPLTESPWIPGMALHPLSSPAQLALPAGHEIRQVDDDRGLADHVDVLTAGFGMPREWAVAFVTDSLVRMPGVAFYVGYQDGNPVTCGMGLRTGRAIGLYSIATVEGARRRGY
ncbi:MAG TPA: hypothetical protein VIR16_11315, partial [Candidatus Limnocylindrales bacterium]